MVIAAFARWHEDHDRARTALRGVRALLGHVAFESFSVLTRLPPPRRAPADLVLAFLAHHFSSPPLVLAGRSYPKLLTLCHEHGLGGGKIYDALIGTTAAASDLTILSLDRRATATYEAVGANYRLIQ